MTDPSRTLSDIPGEGDPASSRTTPPEHAPAAVPVAAPTPAPVSKPEAEPKPEQAGETAGPPRVTEATDTSSSAVDGSCTSATSASEESAVAPASPATSPTAALGFPEGEPQSLHPAHLRTQLISHWITICVMSFVAFTILSSLTVGGALRGVRIAVVPGLAATVISLIAWWGWRYQYLEHSRTSFVISAAGCEIRRGVVWRQIITVPLSRIQHTDVTQGPLQRAYGLATLALYTAGTEHAKVDLSGLSFETAMAIRQYLFERSEAHDPSHPAAR